MCLYENRNCLLLKWIAICCACAGLLPPVLCATAHTRFHHEGQRYSSEWREYGFCLGLKSCRSQESTTAIARRPSSLCSLSICSILCSWRPSARPMSVARLVTFPMAFCTARASSTAVKKYEYTTYTLLVYYLGLDTFAIRVKAQKKPKMQEFRGGICGLLAGPLLSWLLLTWGYFLNIASDGWPVEG